MGSGVDDHARFLKDDTDKDRQDYLVLVKQIHRLGPGPRWTRPPDAKPTPDHDQPHGIVCKDDGSEHCGGGSTCPAGVLNQVRGWIAKPTCDLERVRKDFVLGGDSGGRHNSDANRRAHWSSLGPSSKGPSGPGIPPSSYS